jgi:diguanylate cyclase (GGDEF)-like protein/PAS domain S-box-containing protein
MHRLLRRQVERHLGPGREPGPELRRLLAEIDAQYEQADRDRTSLQQSLDLLSDLVRRGGPRTAPRSEERTGTSITRLARRLVEQAPFAALFCDTDLQVVAWNAGSEKLFGFRRDEALGRDIPSLLLAEADRTSARRELRGFIERGESDQSLRLGVARCGQPRLDEWTVVALRDRRGRPAGAAVLVREPFGAHDRYARAWQGTGDAIWDWDLRKERLWLSDAWTDLVGAGAQSGAPSDWLGRIHEADREAVEEGIRLHLAGQSDRFESEHRLKLEGSDICRWVLARGRCVRDAAGQPVRFSGAMMDVTGRRETAERALRDALHDPLTGLPNRTLFFDLVKRAFARARRREGYCFAVMFLDVDRFKAVNDGLGHAIGDELLEQMSRRLQTCLRQGDTLARLGGDEFTILLDDVKDGRDTQTVADRIAQVTATPFVVSGREVVATVSIGIALSGPGYLRAEDLLHDADTAMYRAKAQGRARSVVFDATMRELTPELLDLEADLRRGLLREEFRVRYLPIIDVVSGHIEGLEALVRWEHPKRGLLTPEQFIPFAEETGLIVPIGRWLMKTAGREIQHCRRVADGRRLTLHVNLSTRQLLHGELLQLIDGTLHEAELDPRDLVVELTEQALHRAADGGAPIAQLRDRGVRLFIDDFGAGPSSIASLHRVQHDSLKIDRSLFSGGSPRGQAPDVVRTIVALARDMGKNVVAEGIETAEQLGFVREVGCSSAQGFFFSPPVEAEVARSLVARNVTW